MRGTLWRKTHHTHPSIDCLLGDYRQVIGAVSTSYQEVFDRLSPSY
ncbi:hypothetical protein [Porphyromonas gingivicanis]|nr:hypothetical protein [Porphyromonas gingivicanis]